MVIDLLFHELAFPGPVTVQAMALAIFKMGFGGKLPIVPPFFDHTMQSAFFKGVFAFGLTVFMDVASYPIVRFAIEKIDIVLPLEFFVGDRTLGFGGQSRQAGAKKDKG